MSVSIINFKNREINGRTAKAKNENWEIANPSSQANEKTSSCRARIIQSPALPEDVTLAVDIDPVNLG